jgi:hypothetical protein
MLSILLPFLAAASFYFHLVNALSNSRLDLQPSFLDILSLYVKTHFSDI